MTDDEQALIATIRDDPSDNTARLVYADWLEERNDPRAEYLRLVVAIAEHTREGKGVDHFTGRLGRLARSIPRNWREVIGIRYRIVLDLFESEERTGLRRLLIAGLGSLFGADWGPGQKRIRISNPLLREEAEHLLRLSDSGRWPSHERLPFRLPLKEPTFRFSLELVDETRDEWGTIQTTEVRV